MTDLPLAERSRLLSALAGVLATLPTEQPQGLRLGEAMRRLVRADGLAITVEYLTDNRTTICASDDLAASLESLQEITGEGPSFEAAREGTPVVTEVGGDGDERWPMLTHAVNEKHGRLHIHAIPMSVLGGVATLYTADRAGLVESAPGVAFLASTVGQTLLAEVAEAEALADSEDAWSARSVVHQATGMVMAQLRVTGEDALVLLRAHAYAMQADMYEVAARVVHRTINFSNFDVEGD